MQLAVSGLVVAFACLLSGCGDEPVASKELLMGSWSVDVEQTFKHQYDQFHKENPDAIPEDFKRFETLTRKQLQREFGDKDFTFRFESEVFHAGSAKSSWSVPWNITATNGAEMTIQVSRGLPGVWSTRKYEFKDKDTVREVSEDGTVLILTRVKS